MNAWKILQDLENAKIKKVEMHILKFNNFTDS
jgi:hypothetical protein